MADYKNINIRNKRATFDYEILEEYIAGVVLVGQDGNFLLEKMR